MSATLLLDNIAAYGLQVLVLVASGAALARVFRIDQPRTALVYWRTLLAVCLLLPFFQPWHTIVPPALETIVVTTAGVPAAKVPGPQATIPAAWPTRSIVLSVLAAGIAARGLWLIVGAFALRRLRRDAWPLDPLPAIVTRAIERTGTQASVLISDRIAGPITFGWRQPVIAFPPSVATMPTDVQEAIACHELLHVKRRDWLSEILEETVRTALWFHPGIWWLIGRVQLVREQVVDEAAIRLTDSRERYIEALLAVARAATPTLTPVSPFLRRHLLKKRVARILQETTMTTRRLIVTLTASAAMLTAAALLAIRSFPLEAQEQSPSGDGPVQIVRGADHLLHGDLPEYPERAMAQKIEGDVVVDLDVDDRGEVADARVLSGPEALRRAALESVLRWHYSPSAMASTTTQAVLRFRVPTEALLKGKLIPREFEVKPDGPSEQQIQALRTYNVELKESEAEFVGIAFPQDPKRTARQIEELEAALASTETSASQRQEYELKLAEVLAKMRGEQKVGLSLDGSIEFKVTRKPVFDAPAELTGVRTERVSEATAMDILAQAGVAVGDTITEDTAKRISKAALAMDEHFRVEFQRTEKGAGVTVVVLAR
jgi:TonB family protein